MHLPHRSEAGDPLVGGLIPEGASLADLQRYIASLESRRGWDSADAERCCFLLGEEVGELFGAVRRHPSAARTDPEGATRAVAHELVDVLNYLLAIANRYDVDLHAAFAEKNAINEQRVWPT